MNSSQNSRTANHRVRAILITAAVVIVLVLGALIYLAIDNLNRTPEPEASAGTSAPTPSVIDENSHVLDDGGEGAVEVVEFLDFECEGCGAFYPVVEELRKKYEGQITYVIRYFPMQGHFNSGNAALAAEAAAQQGKLEDMYNRLFQTQAEWGEARESRAELFRSFAEGIGLDMAAYDAAIKDPATMERIQFDIDAGRELGIRGTPSFFVNGELLQLERYDDVENAIDAGLNGE